MTCDRCACDAKVETAWGESYCGWCYANAPTTDLCPNCSGPASATPVVGVVGGSDAPAPTYSPTGAGAVIFRPSLDDMCHALRLCVQFFEDEADPDPWTAGTALHALGVFRDAVTACIEYRRLRHDPADEPGYQVIRTDVPNELMELASSVMKRVAR